MTEETTETDINETVENLVFNRIAITTEVSAIIWLTRLHAKGLLYHPDDNIAEIEVFNKVAPRMKKELNIMMSHCKFHLSIYDSETGTYDDSNLYKIYKALRDCKASKLEKLKIRSN